MSDTAERRSQQVVKVNLTDTAWGAQIVLATWNDGPPTPEFNPAAQIWNHEFYWDGMSPNGGTLAAHLNCTHVLFNQIRKPMPDKSC